MLSVIVRQGTVFDHHAARPAVRHATRGGLRERATATSCAGSQAFSTSGVVLSVIVRQGTVFDHHAARPAVRHATRGGLRERA
ncbi:hypothetical protein CTI14_67505, partial [Methylobacterium radiotolerans]